MNRTEIENLTSEELKVEYYKKITLLKKDYLFYMLEIERLNKKSLDIIIYFEDSKEEKESKKNNKDMIEINIENLKSFLEQIEEQIEKLRKISTLTI